MHVNSLFKRFLLHISRFTKRSYSSSLSTIKIIDIQAPITGKIRILSLNRPTARNAISQQLLRDLRQEIEYIHTEYDQYGKEPCSTKVNNGENLGPTRALIISSEVDNCFCAGADLKEREGFSTEETASFLTDLRTAFSSLCSIPIPSISAISSVALGGGLELALCTHLRVLASISEVGLPETRLGIIPGAGGTYRLPALIGLPRARDLILTGRRISGQEAHSIGIADRLVEVLSRENETRADLLARSRAAVLKRAINLAKEICEGAPLAIRSALAAVESGRADIESQMYEKVVGTIDRNEALIAFKEKRKPVFTGK